MKEKEIEEFFIKGLEDKEHRTIYENICLILLKMRNKERR